MIQGRNLNHAGGAVASWLLGLSRREKRLFALAVDVTICVWTVFAALYLRLEEWVWPTGYQWLAVIAAPLLAIPIFIKGGLYRAIFRHTGWPAMVAVMRACLIYGAAYALIFTFVSFVGVPRTVGVIQPVLLFLTVGASRALAHYVLGGNYRQLSARSTSSSNVLIYGAGASGRQLAAAVRQSGSMRVVGFLDDDESLQRASLDGIMIHDPADVLDLVDRRGVSDVLLAVPSASRRRRLEILELLRPAQVKVRTLPGLLDLAQGRIQISELRPVQIEDLLGREPVVPDRRLLEKNITGKVVLVTGGGGSIGSELCRQILDLAPSHLLIVESSEFALYAIHGELERRQARGGATRLVPLLASVLDEGRMDAILARWKPATIYHAAAFKHVPLVEQNVLEGIKNNVFGTLGVARLAFTHRVEDFVLISTDKAVRPANVMGATKRLAEMILQALASDGQGVRYSMVRFGNVLGSSGSVVPLFRQQIGAGGPVTITDAEVTRYFMTIPEAAQLVIQAGAMSEGGEVFVLDMGEPVRIHDLAVNMIELSGLSLRDELNPDGDIEIKVIGMRPGEKLYEELLIGEQPLPTGHERIMRAREQFLARSDLDPALIELLAAIEDADVRKAIELLRLLVPEYAPSGDIVDWLASPAAAASAPAAGKRQGEGAAGGLRLSPAGPGR